ncbi:zf-HC2 domain-containing protein [Candidatus Fermentibacteria bacterium]|nr:zf-HC2 domain-containing protein [Candidatus Fermentibacteria bacterium]
MHCRIVRARLSEFLDSYLNPRHREELEAHLKVCPECRQLAREMRRVRDVLGDLDQIAPSATLASRIDRIPWETSQDRSWPMPSATRLGLVAMTVAAAVMVIVLRPAMTAKVPPGPTASIQEQTKSGVVEVHELMLPEERAERFSPQLARVALARGVPLEGPAVSVTATPGQTRDDLIWQEVRRVSACSRRSF